jgi:hypothetical protein
MSRSLRLIHPADYDRLDTPTRTDDIADVLEAAGRLHLDETALTFTQAANMTRLFPRRPADTQASWNRRVNDYLRVIADDLRPWWLADLGVERDGAPVPQWEADNSRVCAEMLAARLLDLSAALR